MVRFCSQWRDYHTHHHRTRKISVAIGDQLLYSHHNVIQQSGDQPTKEEETWCRGYLALPHETRQRLRFPGQVWEISSLFLASYKNLKCAQHLNNCTISTVWTSVIRDQTQSHKLKSLHCRTAECLSIKPLPIKPLNFMLFHEALFKCYTLFIPIIDVKIFWPKLVQVVIKLN